MNKGIKLTNMSKEVGNNKLYFNLNYYDNNIYLNIPLIESMYLNKIDMSLIYSYQDRYENVGFGKGMKPNYYNKLVINNGVYKIIGSDGRVDEYEISQYNKKTNQTIEEIYDDYEDDSYYVLTDKYKNRLEYYDDWTYPNIVTKERKTITVDFDYGEIRNNYDDKLVLVKENNLIKQIIYKYKNEAKRDVLLNYSGEYLSEIIYRENNNEIGKVKLEYLTNKITIRDVYLNEEVSVKLNNDKIDEIIEYGNKTKVVYDGCITRVIDNNDEIEITYDNKNMVLFEKNKYGDISYTKYNDNEVIEYSNQINLNDNKRELKLNEFSNVGVNITKENDYYVVRTTGNNVNKFSYKINTNGVASDDLTLMALVRLNKSLNEFSNVIVDLRADRLSRNIVRKREYDGNYELLAVGISAKSSYSYIEIELTLVGEVDLRIKDVYLFNKNLGSFYTYDKANNLIDSLGKKSETKEYNSDNLVTKNIDETGALNEYSYDSLGHLLKQKMPYGVISENEYDSKGNVTKSSVNGIVRKNEYDKLGLYKTKEIDEFNKEIKYFYDSYGKIIRVEDSIKSLEYDYNLDNTINCLKLGENVVSYGYDNYKRINKITNKNGSIYEFNYDEYNNITSIKLNNQEIYKYSYDELGNIIAQEVGANKYSFSYDSNNNLSKVYYNGSLEYEYVYNNKNELIKVLDNRGNVVEENKITNEGVNNKNSDYELNYYKDNLGDINIVDIKTSENRIISYYDGINRSKASNPDSLKGAYYDTSYFVGNNILENKNKKLVPIQSLEVKKEGVIEYVDVDSSHKLSYKLDVNCPHNLECGFVGFWFKSSYILNNSYLFSTGEKGFIGIYYNNEKIYLEVIDNSGVKYSLIELSGIIKNSWNYVALSFINREDDYSDNICEYLLMLNNNYDIYIKKNPRINVGLGLNPIYNLGHKKKDNIEGNYFNGKISSVLITNRSYLRYDDMLKYYKMSSDYVIENENNRAVNYSGVNNITNNEILNMFEIYPLMNSITSTSLKKPLAFDLREVSGYDKDRSFNYEEDINSYAFVSDGNVLKYETSLSETGTIGISVKTKVVRDKGYLYEALDSSGRLLGLYKDNENKLVIDYNGKTIRTSLTLSLNNWHNVILSYKTDVTSESKQDYQMTFRLKLDDKEEIYIVNTNFRYSFFDISIGRRFTYETDITNLGVVDDYKALYGNVRMLCMRASYCEDVTINKLNEAMNLIGKSTGYDTLGRAVDKEVYNGKEIVLRNEYEYNQTRITNEQIRGLDFEVNRSYSYDELGNIIKINDDKFGSHEYSYNKEGFLIKEDDISYTYDDNGNILTSGALEFSYDSVIKDRLKAVGGYEITYDSSNNPIAYDENTYTYKGRKLIKYDNIEDHYEYKYNHKGLRIEKRNSEGLVIKYIYVNDQLVEEQRNNALIDYLYDEEQSLYGFILNKSTKYYYIRDINKNILGIVDNDGKLMVSYKYDSYGNIKQISGDLSLGNLNPFRYKGYYYDNESGMYYCKSRYYVAYWRRWLNMDRIEYLDNTNIGNINLFSYCNNNPVMMIDDKGNMPKWAKWLIGGALVVGAIALTVATAGLGGGLATALGGGVLGNVASGVIIGAGVGAVSGALTNAGKQIISNGFDNFNWAEVGKSALSGGIAGGIAGGLFSGIKYKYSSKKIAESVSGINKAKLEYSNSLISSCNKNLSKMPFSGSNIAKTLGKFAGNYNNAYSNYVLAEATNKIAEHAFEAAYFLLENLISDLIGLLF